jgi:hypothetical protein
VTKGDANNAVDFWNDEWKLKKVETLYVFNFPKLGFPISWLQGLFSGNTTGAWLSDTQKIGAEFKADQWEVPEIPIPTESSETNPETTETQTTE